MSESTKHQLIIKVRYDNRHMVIDTEIPDPNDLPDGEHLERMKKDILKRIDEAIESAKK